MGGSTKTSQNSSYKPTPEAGAFYSDVFNQARAAQSPYNPATEKSVAGFTDPQMQAFSQIAGNQGVWQPGVTAGADMVTQAGQGIGAADISKFYNPFQSDVIDATLRQMSERDAMQMRDYTANQVAQSGLGGNGFGIGRAQLMGDQAQARGETIAGLRNTGWQQALAAAQADKTRGLAAGQASAGIGQLMSQLGYGDANAMLGAGNQQQQQQQNQYDTASQNALNEQLYPMQQAQWLAGIGAGIGPLMGGTSTGKATQSQGKGAGQVLGAGLTLASMASDERVKEGAVEIGRTHDGQPIYEFNYKGDPRRQIGLMAQDVEKRHPEAVSQGIGGIKMVNYDRALVDAKANGGLALPQGLIGWSDIRPASVKTPELPSAPSTPQDEFDPQAAWDMGKKAGAGISSLFGGASGPAASSPAGGAMAASGLQGYGGAGGSSGILSGIGSLLGFADGGLTPTREEMDALEMQESGGRDIVNPKSGAFGPRQLMPATARDPGFGVRPLDPAGGIPEQRRFSDDYYGAMLKRYGGDRDAARIAYNGGPRRADNWLKAGRDDSVIPAESANYYKQIAERMGPGAATLVAKAQSSGSDSASEPYRGKADRAPGGMLTRTFGIDFNPLNLTENERRALMVAGLSMMSSGNIGRGGLMGMQYLSGAEAGDREARSEAVKLQHQLQKDAEDLRLRSRAEDRLEASEKRQGEQFEKTHGLAERTTVAAEEKAKTEAAQFERTYGLDLNKFNADVADKQAARAWDREKQALDAGKPTDDLKEYAAYAKQEADAGRAPVQFLQYMTQLKQAGRPQTNVSVSGDKKGAEEMAKLFAKRYDALQTNAEGARTMADNLDAVERALDTGVRTGTAAEAELGLRKVAQVFGIGDAEKIAGGELVQAITNKLALQVRAPGGEAGGMPGAMSDADREFLRQTVPGLLRTPEGNRHVLAIMRAAAARHEQIFDMAVDYAEANDGQLGPAFDRQVREFVKANPLSKSVEAILNKPAPVKTETVPGVPTSPAGGSGGFRVLGVQ
jgi:hypothetical protein